MTTKDEQPTGAAETGQAVSPESGAREQAEDQIKDHVEDHAETHVQDQSEDQPRQKVSLDKEEEPEPDNLPDTQPAPVIEQKQAGKLNACFDGFSRIGPLALLAALFCMAWPIFWEPAKGVYCPAELKSLTAFLHCLADGSWLAPTALSGNEFTLAQWPGFTWVIGLLAWSPGLVESGYLLPTASFLCTFFAVLGVWCLCHAAGFGFKAAFAAGLILLCSPLFAPLPHFVGPATLAAGFLMFALVFFCRGWRGNSSWLSLPIAFIFTALAGLSGGLLHLIVPLAASLIYLIWQGKLGRAHRADAVFGFIILLAIFGAWFGSLMLGHVNDSYISLLFGTAWQWTLPIPLKWFLPLLAGMLGCLPWILMIFGVSWVRVLKTASRTISASRHENGSALIWISLVAALIIAIFVPAFHPSAVAIACLVAVLLGKAAINLDRAGNRFFCLLAALALIIAGAAILCLSFADTQELILSHLPKLPVPDIGQMLADVSMLPVIGAIVLLGGLVALVFVRRYVGSGFLIYGILLVIILCQPCRLRLVGELAPMPNSPLVPYATVEARVADALSPPVKEPALPVAPEQAAPEQATPTPPPAYQIPMLAPGGPDNVEPEPATPQEPAAEQTAPIAPDAVAPPETAPAQPAIENGQAEEAASGQPVQAGAEQPETPQPGALQPGTPQPEAEPAR